MGPRSTRAPIAALLFAAILAAGCIGPAAPEPVIDRAEVFLLDYKITSLDGESRGATSGHHCGDVHIDGEKMTVGLWPHEERPPDFPMLAVYSEIPDGWATIGTHPFKTAIPATIDPVHDDTMVAVIEWEPAGPDNGTLRVNGEAVEPPHTWKVTGEDGSWRADATLTTWHGSVDFTRYDGACF